MTRPSRRSRGRAAICQNQPMSKRRLVAVACGVALFAGACGSGTDDAPAGGEEPRATADVALDVAGDEAPAEPATTTDGTATAVGEDPDVAADAPAPAYVDGSSDHLFDQDELHTFELDLTEENLAEIDADPTAEEYVEGTLTFAGETLPVGIRYKGSIGAFVGCVTGSDIFNPSGAKQCTKLSMKVKVNWNDTDDTFYGVKKVQLHSQNLDDTMMHERLGYWLFREMGVPAPRSTHARVVVNGEYVGLFALTEQIDGRFTRETFEDGTGNLYKEIWPLTPLGQPFPDEAYLDALETNEDEDPSADVIRGFGTALAAASPEDRPAVLAEWVDIDQHVAYVAVDRTIRNDDGALHFYCFDGPWCASHNYYWYEEPATGLLHLVPWDLDNAFENIGGNANPVTPIGDAWGEITDDCDPYTVAGSWISQKSATCDPIFGALATFEAEYEAALAELLAGPFSAEQVDARLDEWTAQIEGAVAEAAEAHRDAISVEAWGRALDELRADLDLARAGAG